MEFVEMEIYYHENIDTAVKQFKEFLLNNKEVLAAIIERDDTKEIKSGNDMTFTCYLMFEDDHEWENFMFELRSVDKNLEFEATDDFEDMHPKIESWFKNELKKRLLNGVAG